VPGDTVASGNALWNAINGITGASATNPYLVKIEPGTYEITGIGTHGAVFMKDYVDIEGSGQNVTTIHGAPTNGGDIVLSASYAELRDLTVINEGTGDVISAIGVYAASTAFAISNVTAITNSQGGLFEEALSGVAVVKDSTFIAKGLANEADGIYCNEDKTLYLLRSVAQGKSYALRTSSGDAYIVDSQLIGGVDFAGPGVCVGAYDGSFAALNTSCQ